MHSFRFLGGLVLSLSVPASAVRAQFNIPLPAPPSSAVVFRDDMQMLFVDWNDRLTKTFDARFKEVRKLAMSAEPSSIGDSTLRKRAESFCSEDPNIPKPDCLVALNRDTLLKRFGTDTVPERRPGEVFIKGSLPFFGTRRPKVARYLRYSGGKDGLAILPQFAANISDNQAYVVTSLIRGLIGRGIFSADQAIVVARSGDADAAKRKAIESDQANALRAINNGGTLVMRYTMPMYAATSSDAARAAGLTLSTGVIGPITEPDSAEATQRRNGVASGAFEALVSLPIRGLSGNSEVLADLVLGGRLGYTISGGPLRVGGGDHGVGFGQIVVGLRQNGALSVSALVTFANNGFQRLVPRLGLNLAARH